MVRKGWKEDSPKGEFGRSKGEVCSEKTSHRITKEEKSGKIVANQGIGMETAE
jgi:hypothetical protein